MTRNLEPGAPTVAHFTRLDAGTEIEYRRLIAVQQAFYDGTADRVLDTLHGMTGGGGMLIDTKEHCLQTATRALRDAADEETVVAALLHDIGEPLAPRNHAELAAAILRPYITASTHWVLACHDIFQGHYYFHHLGGDCHARERFRGHPDFERAADFCERWDQRAFDPAYDTLPLEAFEPMVRRIFAREPWSLAPRTAKDVRGPST